MGGGEVHAHAVRGALNSAMPPCAHVLPSLSSVVRRTSPYFPHPSSPQVRVLGMPLGEVYARRHTIKRLRARLNERAVVQVMAWAEEAMVAEAG